MSEGRSPSINMTEVMVESWKLATISMWVDRLNKDEALKLINDTWTWDELWEAAADTHSPAGKKCQIYWTKLKQLNPTKLSIPASRMANS